MLIEAYGADSCTVQPTRPTDLRAPGAIAALLDWRRFRHGDLRMTAPAGPPAPAPAPSTYTPPADQAAFDAMVEGRIARERQKFADYDDLKTKASKYDADQAKNTTDLEKAKNDGKDEGKREATEASHNVLRKAEARVQLGAAKAHNVGDALKLLDLSKVKVNDDGDVDEAAVKALVEDLAKSSPYLFGDGKAPSENAPAGGGTGSGSGSAADAGIGASGSNGGGAGAVFGKSRLAAVKRAPTRTGQQS